MSVDCTVEVLGYELTEHAVGALIEREGRVLRVVYNATVQPPAS